VDVVEPPLLVPRRCGGHRVLGWWLRRRVADVDVLWINDPVAGVSALGRGRPAVYDVTDDWRTMPQDDASRRRIVAAEDELAERALTVVCSDVLADRWRTRYGIDAVVIPNAVDVPAVRAAHPRQLEGEGPHAVYVGTLHANRIDVPLVEQLAESWPGTVHLVGPNGLEPADSRRLSRVGVRLPGPVPSADVPTWLVAADVLICPHLVTDFTLSLDAIKAHEYLTTDRPVVATPSSGFQSLSVDGLAVVSAPDFAATAVAFARRGPFPRPDPASWADRSLEFGAALRLGLESRTTQGAADA
jgi:hypothetical protein